MPAVMIHGVLFEGGQGAHVGGFGVGGFEHDLGGAARFPGFAPARGAQAPAVAGF